MAVDDVTDAALGLESVELDEALEALLADADALVASAQIARNVCSNGVLLESLK